MLVITALPLLAALAGAAPPYVEVALARRTGVYGAELTLREADPRLTALCFNPVGYELKELEAARESLLARPVWLYLGPRRVAQGRIEALDSAADPFGPCAVAAQARFDAPVPLVARSDVLWASTERYESSPRKPVAREAPERARHALPPELAQACLKKTAQSARGTSAGTYVGLVCPVDELEHSAVVLVPKQGEPRVVLLERGERGRLTLVDVLDPKQRRDHRLVLERELPAGRRVELWMSDGEVASPMEAELLFLQSLEPEPEPAAVAGEETGE